MSRCIGTRELTCLTVTCVVINAMQCVVEGVSAPTLLGDSSNDKHVHVAKKPGKI